MTKFRVNHIPMIFLFFIVMIAIGLLIGKTLGWEWDMTELEIADKQGYNK